MSTTNQTIPHINRDFIQFNSTNFFFPNQKIDDVKKIKPNLSEYLDCPALIFTRVFIIILSFVLLHKESFSLKIKWTV